MGLEFSFDEISLDQKVSRDQLEIDLYDELVTISDAEPEEQVRLLAVKPAVPVALEDDKPESIRVTGSLGKDHLLAETPILRVPIASEQTEFPVAPRPAGIAKSGPLPTAYPPMPGEAPALPVTHLPLNGQNSGPFQSTGPSQRTTEIQPPPQARPPVVVAPTGPQPSAPHPPAPAPVPTASTAGSTGACPDCGKPAGELDMICIECGAFIG